MVPIFVEIQPHSKNIKTALRMVWQNNLFSFIFKQSQNEMVTVGVDLSITALRSDILSANTSRLKEKRLKDCSLIRPLFNIDYVCKISWRGGGAFFSLKPSSSHTQKRKCDLAARARVRVCVCACVCVCDICHYLNYSVSVAFISLSSVLFFSK